MNNALTPEPGERPEERFLTVDNLTLDLNSYRVTLDGVPLTLTYHEFELMRLFCYRLDEVIDYRALTFAIWADNSKGAVRRLNVLVHHLRTKLAGMKAYTIETVRGRGYGLLEAIPR